MTIVDSVAQVTKPSWSPVQTSWVGSTSPSQSWQPQTLVLWRIFVRRTSQPAVGAAVGAGLGFGVGVGVGLGVGAKTGDALGAPGTGVGKGVGWGVGDDVGVREVRVAPGDEDELVEGHGHPDDGAREGLVAGARGAARHGPAPGAVGLAGRRRRVGDPARRVRGDRRRAVARADLRGREAPPGRAHGDEVVGAPGRVEGEVHPGDEPHVVARQRQIQGGVALVGARPRKQGEGEPPPRGGPPGRGGRHGGASPRQECSRGPRGAAFYAPGRARGITSSDRLRSRQVGSRSANL